MGAQQPLGGAGGNNLIGHDVECATGGSVNQNIDDAIQDGFKQHRDDVSFGPRYSLHRAASEDVTRI